MLTKRKDHDKWQSFVSDMIWERNGIVNVWTGGADFEEESHFVWVASGRDVTMYFSGWHALEPDGSASENCIEIWTTTRNSRIYWNDLNCNTPINYICNF